MVDEGVAGLGRLGDVVQVGCAVLEAVLERGDGVEVEGAIEVGNLFPEQMDLLEELLYFL
jgi:hypothetical protein